MKGKNKVEPNYMPALRRALRIYDDNQATLAEASSLHRQNVWKLLNQSKLMTPQTAIALERGTKGQVNRLEFFPELIHGNDRPVATVRRMLRSTT